LSNDKASGNLARTAAKAYPQSLNSNEGILCLAGMKEKNRYT